MPLSKPKTIIKKSVVLSIAVAAILFFCVSVNIKAAPPFNHNLSQGDSGKDVQDLQRYLNNNGFFVAFGGAGSLGRESITFGNLTRLALVKFQEFYAKQILYPLGLKKGTGRFSDSTRKFINGQFLAPTTTPPVFNFSPAPKNITLPQLSLANLYQGNYPSGGGGGNSGPYIIAPTLTAPAITFNNFTKTFGDTSFTPSPASNSGGSFSFSSSNALVATGGSNLTIIGAGTAIITATQAASGNFTSGSATSTLTVNKKIPNLVWSSFNLPMITVAEEESGSIFPMIFPTNPTSDSPGTFFLYTGDPSLFSVNPTTGNGSALQDLDPDVASSYTLTIGQMETANFLATTTTAVVTPTDPNDCTPNPCNYGGTCASPKTGYSFGGFTCTCSAGMNGLTCDTAIDECGDAPCQNGGTCTRVSTLGGPLNSYSCSCTSGYGGTNCDVVVTTPTISFSLSTTTVDASPFTISASSSSSGTFTFTSSSSTVATISGNTVTVHGVIGTSTLTATQAPSGGYGTGTQTTILYVAANSCSLGNPCIHGGTCLNHYPSGRDCSCVSPYSGNHCELSTVSCDGSEGEGQRCFNGGTCEATAGGGECSCPICYTGTYCDTYEPDICAAYRTPQNFTPYRIITASAACYAPQLKWY